MPNEFQARYHEYLRSPEWLEKRKLINERDNGICEICKTHKIINIHHKTYENVFHEPLQDLAGLCKECHDAIHDIYITEDYEFWLDGRTIPQDLKESEQLLKQWYKEKRDRTKNDWIPPKPRLTNDPVFNALLLRG
jgi:hypothetical protein